MPRPPSRTLGFGAAALFSAIAVAQSPPLPVFRSRVDAIELEVRVFDADGRAVTDLDRDEVEIYEDGRRQEITAFGRVTIPGASNIELQAFAAAAAGRDIVTNREAADSRIFVLVLDDLHVDRRNTEAVKKAARRFVERYLEPADLVAVIYTGVRPDAAQDFTSDRRLLLAAIDKFIGRKLVPATVERMEQYNTLFRARGSPRFEDLRDRHDAERAFNARSAMATIESISSLLGRVSGRRKAALLFSEGVDYDLAGLRSRGRIPPSGPTILAPTIPTGASEADAMGRLDVHSYAHDVLLSVQGAVGAASRANLALYPVDVQGGDTSDSLSDLGAPVDDPSLGLSTANLQHEMRDAQETLTVLAENTGGFAALSPMDYDAAFARIMRESSEYYLLAYSPWNPAPDGTYRDLKVRVNRAGVRVAARRGYYAPKKSPTPRIRFEAFEISEATSTLVMAPIPMPGLGLTVQAVPLPGDKNKKTDVIVTTLVDGRDVAGSETTASNIVEIAVIAVDSGGKVHAATGRAIDVKLGPDATHVLRHAGYRVISRLQVPPGRYQIRQAVRERNGGRQGSIFADVDVPAFSNSIALGGILLSSARAGLVPTSVDPETLERLPILPSPRRAFSLGDELVIATEISQPSHRRDIDVVATVTEPSGQERYRRRQSISAEAFRGNRGLSRYVERISLTDGGGQFLLTLEVRAPGSPAPLAARRVAFSVDRP